MKLSEHEKDFDDMLAQLRTAREMGFLGIMAGYHGGRLVIVRLDWDNSMGKLRDDFAKSGKNISDAEPRNHVNGCAGEASKHYMESQNDTSYCT